jgi:hypothetical protein
MRSRLLFFLFALASSSLAEVTYEFQPDFIKPQSGRQTIGNSHGEIACDSAGNFYVSVQEKDAGLQVYSPIGEYVKTLALPQSLHGFVIRKDDSGEFIYAAVLGEKRFIKAQLDGTVVMEIPTTAFPAEQRDWQSVGTIAEADKGKPGAKITPIAEGLVLAHSPKEVTLKLADGSEKRIEKTPLTKMKGGLSLTGCDVASNGDIYIVDGYGRSWIFQFDQTGKFKKVFGGPVAPYNFNNTHKIFIDKRFSPERIVALDRGNNRMLHLDLEGNILGTIADNGLRNPSSASFHGDLMCVAEIAGRVSVWDKDNKLVAELGTNPNMTNTPKIEPKDWQQGVVTSPHGITFDNAGNVLETEWNQWGRVLRWNKK